MAGYFKDTVKLIWEHGGDVKRASGKGYLAQMLQILLYRLKGYGAKDYYVFFLYRGLSKPIINSVKYATWVRRLNKKHPGVFPFDKWVFGNLCENFNLPSPKCYGVFHPVWGVQGNGRSLRSEAELHAFLAEKGGSLVFKPAAGAHGADVVLIDSYDQERKWVHRASGEAASLHDFFEWLCARDIRWLIQDRIVQHPDLARLNGSSVNCLRIITYLDDEGVAKVVSALLKVGRANSEIDNATGGGMIAAVDLETGRTGTFVEIFNEHRFTHHPDSGEQIADFPVPYLTEALELTKTVHRLLPYPRHLGWDVAISPDGPLLIEPNSYMAHHLIQEAGARIFDPDFVAKQSR
ncbi:sugar-transfer associated ATP-grasp domain-containing protein [Pelagibius marinus]|uniref:sugar-transfer associated ATP-grasp domain-containing protein n=1 Tax=Pelagibius marinus TaxID=2762760 RepID=UPI0018728B90|nr:sugar-transfer associated ATP-grasp domain-containing protein [Pelagibius marinus]